MKKKQRRASELRVDWPSTPGDLMHAEEDKRGLLWARTEARRALCMMGDGWSARLWYNLGWHFALHRPFLNLHPQTEHKKANGNWVKRITGWTAYICLLPAQEVGGELMRSASEPREAIRAVVGALDAQTRAAARAVNVARQALNPKPVGRRIARGR